MRCRCALLLCLLAVVAPSCAQKSKSRIVAPVVTGPAPSSPAGAVQLLEWCWKNRGIGPYAEVFTGDHRFHFALGDSAGNAYRDAPFTREDELDCATWLFVGTTDHPAASEILLDFDKVLIALNDDRPGRDPGWHKSIRTKVNLKVTLDRGSGPEVNEVNGYAKFYVVRGDSAEIPAELIARGFKADSTRWWIERWDDETLLPGGANAHPAQSRTWGGIKTLYR